MGSALLWLLLARSAWDKLATMEAVATGEGDAVVSVRLVVVDSTNLCGAGHDS